MQKASFPGCRGGVPATGRHRRAQCAPRGVKKACSLPPVHCPGRQQMPLHPHTLIADFCLFLGLPPPKDSVLAMVNGWLLLVAGTCQIFLTAILRMAFIFGLPSLLSAPYCVVAVLTLPEGVTIWGGVACLILLLGPPPKGARFGQSGLYKRCLFFLKDVILS